MKPCSHWFPLSPFNQFSHATCNKERALALLLSTLWNGRREEMTLTRTISKLASAISPFFQRFGVTGTTEDAHRSLLCTNPVKNATFRKKVECGKKLQTINAAAGQTPKSSRLHCSSLLIFPIFFSECPIMSFPIGRRSSLVGSTSFGPLDEVGCDGGFFLLVTVKK